MFFQFPLEEVTEVIVLEEILSNIQIDKIRAVAKTVYFFEFSSSYKNNVFFGYFSSLSSLYYLIFFSDLNLQ